MPDLTRGHTFSSGDSVTHSSLNNLVGNATLNDNAVTEAKIYAGSVTNAKVHTSADIALSKLATGTDGQVIIGNSTGVPTYVSVTGDVTLTNAGVSAIGPDKVLTAMIADSTGASDGITTAKLATGAATGPKIAMGSDAQGDVLYHNGTSYVRLAAGTSGQLLKTQGSSANPVWVDPPPAITVTEYAATTTWTRPTGVSVIYAVVLAGGGGSTARAVGGNGGSAGSYLDVSGTLGGAGSDEIEITVGAGGTAGHGIPDATGWVAGGNGTNTTFGLDGETPYLTGIAGTGSYRQDYNVAADGASGGAEYSGRFDGGSGHITLGQGGAAGDPDSSHGQPHNVAGNAGGAGMVLIVIIG